MFTGFENSVKIAVVNNPSYFSNKSMSLVSNSIHKDNDPVWKIDDTTCQIWSILEKPIISDTNGVIDEQYITHYDYMFGCVSIDTERYTPVGQVTVSGYTYGTTTVFAGCKEISVNMSNDLADTTTYTNNGGGRFKRLLTRDLTMSITKNIENDTLLENAYSSGYPIIVEWIPSANMLEIFGSWDSFSDPWDTYTEVFGESTPHIWRGIFVLDSLEESGAVDGVEEYTLNLVLYKGVEDGKVMTFSVWCDYNIT